MKIYSIGDLHLASNVDKPMDVFGDKWHKHEQKIIKYWCEVVKSEDVVMVPGDISWAMRYQEAQTDLACLDQLPGKKILIRGNHDYWWEKISQLNKRYRNIYFLQNTSIKIAEGLYVCGTRGWTCPGDNVFSEQDEKIYNREYQRLKLSLEHAKKQGAREIIVLLHYPPTNSKKSPSLFTDLITSYPVSHVIYGHLHDPEGHEQCLKGRRGDCRYHLVAADYLDFRPKEIICLSEEKTQYETTSSI